MDDLKRQRQEEIKENLLDAIRDLLELTGAAGFILPIQIGACEAVIAVGRPDVVLEHVRTHAEAPDVCGTAAHEKIEVTTEEKLHSLREALGASGALVFAADLSAAFPVDWDERLGGYRMRAADEPPPTAIH